MIQGYYLRIKDLIDKRLGDFYGEMGLDNVSQSYKRYGLHRDGNKYIYREWAPGAKSISIFGEFNSWKRGQYHCEKVNLLKLSPITVCGFAKLNQKFLNIRL